MKNKYLITSSMMLAVVGAMPAIAFDNTAGWKLDADGNIEKDTSGNPIYVDSAGKSQSVQGDTISRLNGEASSHRKDKEAAEKKLATYKDIDPVKAAEAIATLAKIDQKTLVDAGEMDKVKAQISEGFTAQIAERDATIAEQSGKISGMTIDTAFATSDFINNVSVPKSMFKAEFSKHFKVEDGKPVPYGPDGNKVYSKKNMGELAGFDEALEILVGQRSDKDDIMKADNQQGSGNQGDGGGRGNGRVMQRSEFDALTPSQQAETATLVGKGEVTIAK